MDYSRQVSQAQAAAHAASEAVTELLRFLREGPNCNDPHGDVSPTELLTDAVRLAIAIEEPYLAEQPCYASYRDAVGQLAAACSKFLMDTGAIGRACRICGCTENNACITENGPCAWAEIDLCTACADRAASPPRATTEITPADIPY